MKIFLFIFIVLIFAQSQAWERNYKFTYLEKEYSFSIIQNDEYISGCRAKTEDWQNKNGALSKEYQKNIDKYVLEYPCSEIIKLIAEKIHKEFLKVKSTKFWDELNFNIAFVNSLKYKHDDVTFGYSEYYATPFETLDKGQQDCEDSSFLLSHLFYILGYNSLLITLVDHVAVCVDPFSNGVCNTPTYEYEMNNWSYITEGSKKYYYCESTPPGPGVCNVVGRRPKFAQGKVFEQQLVQNEKTKKAIEQMEDNVAVAMKRLKAQKTNVKIDRYSSSGELIYSPNGGALYIEPKKTPEITYSKGPRFY